MLVAALLTVAFTAIGALSAWGAWKRSQREKALPAVARRAGLQFASVDPFNSLAVAFPLFRAGDGRKVENVMWRGAGPPGAARVFDYSWYDEHRDNNGQVRRSWTYLTCAMAQHNGRWPAVRITRQGVLDSLGERLGLRSVDLESEAFNRQFFVRCDDPKFATDLLSPQMMELLLSTEGRVTVETKGRFVLLSASRVDAHLMPGFLRLAEEFLERIPPVVFDLHGRFPDGAGTETMPAPEEGLAFGGIGSSRPARSDSLGWTPHDYEFAPPPDLRRTDDPWDPTPGVEHDLDGNVIERVQDPWGEGRPLPGDS